MKALFHILAGALIVAAIGCKDSGPVASNLQPAHPTDTLTYQVTTGITLSLVGLRDTYSLNDTVTGFIQLVNASDSVPLVLCGSGRPDSYYDIYPKGSTEIVCYYPSTVYPMEYRDTLRLGDTLRSYQIWDQSTWDPIAQRWTSLKAFSGSYTWQAWRGGNRLVARTLTKYFTISEQGDSLSAALFVDYSSTDSVIADFALRNRVGRTVTLDPSGSRPITLAFVHQQDTLISFRFPLPTNERALLPKSDQTILHFSASKRDTAFAQMNGAFDMRAILNLQSRSVIASGFQFLR